MKIGLLQYAPVFGNLSQTMERITTLLNSSSPADLWVLPELASTGYVFNDRNEAFSLSETVDESHYVRFLQRESCERNCWFVTGFCEREGDKLYNSALLISPQGVEGVYRKLHLFKHEKGLFEPGNLGLPLFTTPWGKVALLVCFDWMFPEVWRWLSLRGADLICHPSNLILPWCQKALPGYALTNRIYIASANRVGEERGYHFTGQSLCVSPLGESLISMTPHEAQAEVCEVELSLSREKWITPENHAWDDRRTDLYQLTVESVYE